MASLSFGSRNFMNTVDAVKGAYNRATGNVNNNFNQPLPNDTRGADFWNQPNPGLPGYTRGGDPIAGQTSAPMVDYAANQAAAQARQ
jgi:hypothetical protein